MPTVFDGVPRLENFDVRPALSAFAAGRDMRLENEDRATAEQDKIAEIVANAAYQADTPEKWSQFIGVLSKRFPGKDLSPFADFNAREGLIAQGPDRQGRPEQMTPYQAGSLGLARERFEWEMSQGAGPDYGTAAPGATVFDKTTGQPVFTADAKPTPEMPAGPPSVTTQRAILEADEAIMAGEGVIQSLDRALEINDKAWSGPGAGVIGKGMSLVGADSGVATEELSNIVTTQALSQLKAIFGGMPTEGERKILLEIQGSVNQAPAVRKGIYERARAAAERRIAFNRERVEALRSGTYYQPENAAGNTTTNPENIEGDLYVVQSDDDYDAVPSGAHFIAPDGTERVKP